MRITRADMWTSPKKKTSPIIRAMVANVNRIPIAQSNGTWNIPSMKRDATTRQTKRAEIVHMVIAWLVKCLLRSSDFNSSSTRSNPRFAITSFPSVSALPLSMILERRPDITFNIPAIPVNKKTGPNASWMAFEMSLIFSMGECIIQITNYEFKITNYKLRITNVKLRIIFCLN